MIEDGFFNSGVHPGRDQDRWYSHAETVEGPFLAMVVRRYCCRRLNVVVEPTMLIVEYN